MIRTDGEIMPTVVPTILDGLDRTQLVNNDMRDVGEAVLDIALPPTVGGTAVLINPSTQGELGVLRLLTNGPDELNVDPKREAAPVKSHAWRPTLSFAQRQAHRARNKALLDSKMIENL